MSKRNGTLLAWHSKNHGIEVLRHAVALLSKRGHAIGRVVYVTRTSERVSVGDEWSGPPVEVLSLTIRDPSNHQQVYEAVSTRVVPAVRGEGRLHINVSPGTPAMHTVWLLLHAGGAFPAGTRLWSSQREGKDGPVRIDPVEFPVTTYLAEVRRNAVATAPVAQYDPQAKSVARRAALELLARFAMVEGAPLLVLGERGTGKTRLVETLVASVKRRKVVVTVPCGALDSSLAEAELFGHVKGAYTGADQPRTGLLGSADGGVLFLDEVQDLPRAVQRKLVRVLQDRHRRYRPVGGDEERSTDAEVVCASNQPLHVLAERLDPDLFDRLAHLVVDIPPLRECREDLGEDWPRVWAELRRREDVPAVAPISAALEALLSEHPLPGNLRDLQRLALMAMAWWDGHTPAQAFERAITSWRSQPSAAPMSGAASRFGHGSRSQRVRDYRRQLALWAKSQYGTWEQASMALSCDERTLRDDAAPAERGGKDGAHGESAR